MDEVRQETAEKKGNQSSIKTVSHLIEVICQIMADKCFRLPDYFIE